MTTICKICGSTAEHRTYAPKEMMLGIRDEHQYFECADCGCLQIDTIPDNIADYYPKDYYSYAAKPPQNAWKQKLIHARNIYAVTGKSIVGKLAHILFPEAKLSTLRHLQLAQDAKIMDVGCGAGNLLQTLKSINFDNLLGIDPYNDADIEYDSGLVIKKQLLEELAEQNEQHGHWNVIMFHHSFEHIADQHGTLEHVHQLLQDNGTCLIRIPTVSSYAWQHYQLDWVQLDAPRHLFLHSVNSMKQLAEQHGFQVEHVAYDSNALQFWGSEQYQQDIPLNDPRSYAESPEDSPFTDKQIQQFEHRAKELNAHQQGDQAAFYLRKV